MDHDQPLPAKRVPIPSPECDAMTAAIKRAMRMTAELNKLSFDDVAKVRQLFGELTGRKVDDTLILIPPFYSAYGLTEQPQERLHPATSAIIPAMIKITPTRIVRSTRAVSLFTTRLTTKAAATNAPGTNTQTQRRNILSGESINVPRVHLITSRFTRSEPSFCARQIWSHRLRLTLWKVRKLRRATTFQSFFPGPARRIIGANSHWRLVKVIKRGKLRRAWMGADKKSCSGSAPSSPFHRS